MNPIGVTKSFPSSTKRLQITPNHDLFEGLKFMVYFFITPAVKYLVQTCDPLCPLGPVAPSSPSFPYGRQTAIEEHNKDGGGYGYGYKMSLKR